MNYSLKKNVWRWGKQLPHVKLQRKWHHPPPSGLKFQHCTSPEFYWLNRSLDYLHIKTILFLVCSDCLQMKSNWLSIFYKHLGLIKPKVTIGYWKKISEKHYKYQYSIKTPLEIIYPNIVCNRNKLLCTHKYDRIQSVMTPEVSINIYSHRVLWLTDFISQYSSVQKT